MLEIRKQETVKQLVHLYAFFVRRLHGRYKLSKVHTLCLKNRALSLKIGGKVDYKYFTKNLKDFYQFIQVNQFDEKLLTLGIQLNFDQERGVSIPVEYKKGGYQHIYWKELEKKATYNEMGRLTGYSFFYRGALCFKTTATYTLSEDFVLNYKGISLYNPKKTKHLLVLDRRDPGEWENQNIVELWTYLGTPLDPTPGYFLVLRDSTGEIYCLAIEKGVIVGMDSNLLHHQSLKGVKQFDLRVTAVNFREILEEINQQRVNGRVTYDYLLFLFFKKGRISDLFLAYTFGEKLRAIVDLPKKIVRFFKMRGQRLSLNFGTLLLNPYKSYLFDVHEIQKKLVRIFSNDS